MNKYGSYKYCFVPQCPSTSVTCPEKQFFSLPIDVKLRKMWCKSARLKKQLSMSRNLWCCENHFDMKEDASNYTEHTLTNSRLKLKKGAIPHIFLEQNRGQKTVNRSEAAVEKLNRKRIVNEILAIDDETSKEKSNSDSNVPVTELKNDMDNYMEWKFTNCKKMLKKDVIPHKFECQKIKNEEVIDSLKTITSKRQKRALNDLVETCTTCSSNDQIQQPKMSESCIPLEVKIKEEKLNEIFPCDLCLDVFCTFEDLNLHVNDKHLKIEINDESITEKIKQENDVEDDMHMKDEGIQIVIKNELIIDKIKNEKLRQIKDDIS